MLDQALAALAATAGTGLVTAMVTDGWLETRRRAALLLGRGDADEETRQETRLERARAEVVEDPQAGERHADRWSTRFEDLLDDRPDLADDLRDLVAHIAAHAPVQAHHSNVVANSRIDGPNIQIGSVGGSVNLGPHAGG